MRKVLKKLALVMLLGVSAMVMTGCNEQVPAGYGGKILGEKGWLPEIYPPSKVWVKTTLTTVPQKLFLYQTTTQKFVQPIKVLLKDKLTLTAEIVFRGRITNNKKLINAMFNDIPMNDNVVTTKEVYETYGKMIVMNTARAVISKYNVDEVNKNYERITVELYNAIAPKLKGLAMDISDVTMGEIKYPKIVTDAIEAAKKRRMEIETAKAQVQIELQKADGREQVAKAEYRIKMLEAKRIRDYNKMIEQGVTPNLLKLRQLEVQEKMVDAIKNNKNVVYMPMDMMNGSTNMRIIK
jgi:regulator of protease activity HflC (stomatin/prohibitin superfamily)